MGWDGLDPNQISSLVRIVTPVLLSRDMFQKSNLLMAAGILNLLDWGWVRNKYGMLPPTSIAQQVSHSTADEYDYWLAYILDTPRKFASHHIV